jgi:MoxR-like ATPase
VLAADRTIQYRASSVVTAMIRGEIVVLDEANRMSERSWASLAPLMDDRRYVESAAAAVTIKAHPDFRLCVTMNADASVYELPAYIQSRLRPRIEITNPPWEMQEAIVRRKSPGVDPAILDAVLTHLQQRSLAGQSDTPRDMLTLAQYAQKLANVGLDDPVRRAADQTLDLADA